ncbi:transposase, Mutator family protein [Rickettsia bellii str. RML Mogi]|uniref:Mutator family transposase n=1 Tax=Rickettsia bellii str. RML Mogi TaxID=1359194 RepID=A0A0F3QJU9_RICBE|nr:transposase, Mutator family protein [Rickettsia bellii str. RML Mogi]
MKKDVTTNNIAEQVTKLPSVQNEALAEIIKGLYQGKPLLGSSGLLTSLVKDLTQIALQGEMDSHLHENSLEQGGNRRNGVTTKTIKTGSGSFELAVPRDRNSTFEPQLIKKKTNSINRRAR